MSWEATVLNWIFLHLAVGTLVCGALMVLNLLKRWMRLGEGALSWLWYLGYVAVFVIPFVISIKQSSDTVPSPPNLVPDQSHPVSYISSPATDLVSNAPIRENISSLQVEVSESAAQTITIAVRVLALIWLLGSMWLGVVLVRRMVATNRLSRSMREVADFENTVEFSRPVFISDQVASPMVLGLWAPKILLPKTLLRDLSEEELRHVLLHEEAHIKRADLWAGAFQELLAVLVWISPIQWLFYRQVSLSRELACDSRVAHQVEDRNRYAQTMLNCAERILCQRNSILAMGMYHRRNDIKKRIREIVTMKSKKSSTIAASVVGLCALAGSVALAQTSVPKITLLADKAQKPAIETSELNQAYAEMMVYAANNNQLSVIKHMVRENGFDVDTPAEADGTALIIAVQRGNEELVEELLKLGADVNAPSPRDGNPLINAALMGNLSIAKRLVAAGADVNAYVYRDETPLICASQQGHLDMVKYLVENGANVNLEVETPHDDAPNNLRSPLSVARDSEVIAYLEIKGAR